MCLSLSVLLIKSHVNVWNEFRIFFHFIDDLMVVNDGKISGEKIMKTLFPEIISLFMEQCS